MKTSPIYKTYQHLSNEVEVSDEGPDFGPAGGNKLSLLREKMVK